MKIANVEAEIQYDIQLDTKDRYLFSHVILNRSQELWLYLFSRLDRNGEAVIVPYSAVLHALRVSWEHKFKPNLVRMMKSASTAHVYRVSSFWSPFCGKNRLRSRHNDDYCAIISSSHVTLHVIFHCESVCGWLTCIDLVFDTTLIVSLCAVNSLLDMVLTPAELYMHQ